VLVQEKIGDSGGRTLSRRNSEREVSGGDETDLFFILEGQEKSIAGKKGKRKVYG